jgi:phosphoribosylpyrophosphate synthetase
MAEEHGQAIVDKYALTNDKLYMSVEEAIALSQEIASRLSSREPRPDCVVGIANGALLMTKVIADALACPMTMISFRRRGSRLKQWLDRVPGATLLLSRAYGIPLVRLPLYWVLRCLQGLSTREKHGVCPEVRGRTVALLDDCIETGQSICAAEHLLMKNGASDIIICCLCWSQKTDSVAAHGVRPHIYIGRRVQHYPWSMNSPFRKELQRHLAASTRNGRT